MNDISLKLEIRPDKPLKNEYVALLSIFDAVAKFLNIDYFLAGAQARDLILGHVFNQRTGQATYDLDLGIGIEDWNKFETLKSALITTGNFTADTTKQKMYFKRPEDQFTTQLDLIPFGGVENGEAFIKWPPEMNIVMNVGGFSEAFKSAISVKISEDLSIRVASLSGMAVLKLIAWRERGLANQGKDAMDFLLIARNHHSAGNENRIYTDESLLESTDFDPELAGIILLGRDVADICQDTTIQKIHFIFLKSKIKQSLIDQLTSNSQAIGDLDSVLKVEKQIEHFIKGLGLKL
jgi:predicted nucleotidyltransferase